MVSSLEGISVAFWWVNHKQTYGAEVGGGYIWSPKTNRNGSKNQSCYLAGISNELGDRLLSLAPEVQLRAATPSRAWNVEVFDKKEKEYLAWVEANPSGFVANMDKAKSMKQYPMIHSAGDAAISKDKRGNFTTNYYFKICSTDLRELRSYLKHEYHRFTYCMKCFETLEERQEHEAAAIEEIQHSALPVTEKEQLVKSRRGQGLFRSRLEQIEHACRVTGVTNKARLIASHIKPWSKCEDTGRLDGHNGLLLSPHIDKLFDRGWITFTDSGDLLCAEPSIEQALQKWGVELPLNVAPFEPKQARYLAYHRDEIFRAEPVTSP